MQHSVVFRLRLYPIMVNAQELFDFSLSMSFRFINRISPKHCYRKCYFAAVLFDNLLSPSALTNLEFFVDFCTGLRPELRLLWVLCHGFASVKLIQHLLNTFPSCASIGMHFIITDFAGIWYFLVDTSTVLAFYIIIAFLKFFFVIFRGSTSSDFWACSLLR